jgi:hypothetical protein
VVNRLAVLFIARTVVPDQSPGGCDDLRRRTVIAVDDVDLDVAILVRKVQDEPHVRRPERIERLVVVADRPQLHARGHETIDQHGLGFGLLVGLDPLQDCRLGTSLRDLPHIGFADMPLPGGSGSQDLFDHFGAELAGGQHEDRLKAEVIENGLEKRSACVFEVQGVGPSGGLHIILR